MSERTGRAGAGAAASGAGACATATACAATRATATTAEAVAAFEGRIAKVSGPARSGKTQACALRALRLLERGVDPADVLVVVASAGAASAVRVRLEALAAEAEAEGAGAGAGEGVSLRETARKVRVRRAVEVCEDVMGDPAAVALTGRGSRVMNDAEYTFFLEDLKTLGQKNRRLHNMLLFFFAQWSDLRREGDWLLRGEETDLLAYARRVLASLGVAMRHELPYLCAEFLGGDCGMPFAQRYGYVLCDDFQDLSYAEQTCMALLARDQLMVFGDAGAVAKVNTDYPSPEGFERFDRVRKGVETFSLERRFGPAGVLAIDDALGRAACGEASGLAACAERVGGLAGGAEPAVCADPVERADQVERADPVEGVTLVEWTTPDEGLAGVAGFVARRLAEDPGESVAVAVPDRRWGGFVERALAARGLAVDDAGLGRRLGGDPRTPGAHGAASAYVALRLLADPQDPLAWRAWTGFDNAITNSEAWVDVYRASWERGVGVVEVLRKVAAGEVDVLKGDVLSRAWERGQAMVEACRDLRGAELAAAVGLGSLPGVFGPAAGLRGDEGATELLAGLDRWLDAAVGGTAPGVAAADASGTAPDPGPSAGVVHVALPENLVGCEFDTLVVAGMVDGMLPRRAHFDIEKTDEARAQALDEDRARLRLACTRARRRLVLSTFVQTTIEVADRSNMQIRRITAAGGSRVALVSPSLYLGEMVPAAPAPVRELS